MTMLTIIENAAYLSKRLNAPIVMHKADFELSRNNMLEPLFAHSVLGKIVLALSIKSFERDKIEPFTPSRFVQDSDLLKDYNISYPFRAWQFSRKQNMLGGTHRHIAYTFVSTGNLNNLHAKWQKGA